MQMTYSKSGLQLTENSEGCKLVSYKDIAGVWTNGYGNTHGVVPNSTITQIQAEHDLLANISHSVADVNRLVTVELTQAEFDALVDFDFNLGCGSLAKSTLLKDVNASNFAAAANEFEKWDMAGGKVVAGLLRRRLAEKQEFVGVA